MTHTLQTVYQKLLVLNDRYVKILSFIPNMLNIMFPLTLFKT